MKSWSRCTTIVVTTLTVLTISAMWTVPARADDATPPPAATPEVVQPTEESSSPELHPVSVPTRAPVEAVVTELAPTKASPAKTAVVRETTLVAKHAPKEQTTMELLAHIPNNTEVVVLDENDQAVPLASQAAADIIYTGDPIWCPVGVAPGGAGCSSSFASLNALVATFVPTTNGVIWIQNVGDVTTGPVSIDGVTGNWASAASFSLALKGGWNGNTGSAATNPLAPSTINDPLSITNWNANITLSDIVIAGVTGAGSTALTITTSRNITLTRVDVGNDSATNEGSGAVLDNTAIDAGTGNVTITDSHFSYNAGGRGLYIRSRGTITLSNVSANNNGEIGAVLDNGSALTAKNVTLISGLFEFNENGDEGLNIWTKGAITLKDITAVGNRGLGAELNNNPGVANITLLGSNVFSENGAGLNVNSRGAIIASNLIVNGNWDLGYGAILANYASETAQPIILTGSSEFKFNSFSGLEVVSSGAISLNNITVNNNGGIFYGAFLDNLRSSVASNITLTGLNVFNGNAADGLEIKTLGSITLSNITANNNGYGEMAGYGAILINNGASGPRSVTLLGANNFSSNYMGGLVVESKGAIIINKLTASANQDDNGASLDNTYGSPSNPQNVTLLGFVNVNGNSGAGLNVLSYGAINLINVTANENGFGHAGSGVYLDNHSGTLPRTVMMTGTNNFQNNMWDGLYIASLGAITINNVIADNNLLHGLYLDNHWLGAVGGITINNTPTFSPDFSNNGDAGIEAYTSGNIILKDLDAIGNGRYGVYLDNTSGAASTVTVGTSRLGWCNGLMDNFNSGMEVYSNGAVTLGNLCISGNGNNTAPAHGYGLYVKNDTATTPRNVTLLGTNRFNGNYSGGVYIYTKGTILADRVTANDNIAGTGALFDNNTNPALPQNVTLLGYGDFYRNAGRGLDIATFGIVTLNSLHADTNSSDGIYVDNFTGATQVRSVTVNGYAEAYSNGGTGLVIHSKGAILVSNLDAWNNSNAGASLDNSEAGALGGVTISGHAWAGSSGSDFGLWVQSLGAITITNLSTWNNGTFGALLDNAKPGSVSGVTVAGCAAAGNNGTDGLIVLSNRAITLTNLYTDTNGGTGALLVNHYSGSTSPQNVTVNGYGNFYNNGDDGLHVLTYGSITLSNITANGNGWGPGTTTGYGAYLDNCLQNSGICTATMTRGITLNGNNSFNGNTVHGLYAASPGVIKTNNLTANGNAGAGAFLQNQWDFSNQSVILTGMNSFASNRFGLDVLSNGGITISNLSANLNTTGGAWLYNYSLTATPVFVTLTGNNTFVGNSDGSTATHGESGLAIYSDGNITINNLTANWNDGDGAFLSNCRWDSALGMCTGLSNITLTGTNTFLGNYGDGLYTDSHRNITLSKVSADNNGGTGVYAGADGNITVMCGSMTNNGMYGWSFGSPGTVNLIGVFAYGNGTNKDPRNGTFVYIRTCPLP